MTSLVFTSFKNCESALFEITKHGLIFISFKVSNLFFLLLNQSKLRIRGVGLLCVKIHYTNS